MKDRDLLLLEQFRAGNADAFTQLVEQYAPRVYNVVLRMAKDASTAEDLLQDAIIQAYHSIDKFRGECSFYTWLYRIAVNKTLNFLRRNQGKIVWESLDEPRQTGDGQMKREVVDWSENPEKAAEQLEMGQIMAEAIASLGDGNRTVFTLREIEGMEFEQIAEVLGCTQDAVRTRLHRAKKELKEKLRPYLENKDRVWS